MHLPSGPGAGRGIERLCSSGRFGSRTSAAEDEAEVLYAPASSGPIIDHMMGASVTPLVPVGRDECIDLLKTAACGRLAMTASAMPTILPVAIEMHGEDVRLRSLLGSHVLVHPDQVVALEADNLDDVAPEQWSVVVLGMLVVEEHDGEPGGSCTSPRFRLKTEFVSGWRSGAPSALAGSTRNEATEGADGDLLRIR